MTYSVGHASHPPHHMNKRRPAGIRSTTTLTQIASTCHYSANLRDLSCTSWTPPHVHPPVMASPSNHQHPSLSPGTSPSPPTPPVSPALPATHALTALLALTSLPAPVIPGPVLTHQPKSAPHKPSPPEPPKPPPRHPFPTHNPTRPPAYSECSLPRLTPQPSPSPPPGNHSNDMSYSLHQRITCRRCPPTPRIPSTPQGRHRRPSDPTRPTAGPLFTPSEPRTRSSQTVAP